MSSFVRSRASHLEPLYRWRRETGPEASGRYATSVSTPTTELQPSPPPSARWLGPLYLRRPGDDHVAAVVASLSDAELTYGPVGQTRDDMPDGWAQDACSGVLGEGEAIWDRAVDALRRWTQFDLGWVDPHDRTVPLSRGATFAFVSNQLAFHSINVCRVVYTIDETEGDTRRFGFAYGTVGSHVVKGEEQFLLEMGADGRVCFSVRKFSRPGHPLVWLAGPLARRIQRRFSEDAIARMAAEVAA